MRHSTLVVLLAAALCGSVFAADPPRPAEALPPPDIDAPATLPAEDATPARTADDGDDVVTLQEAVPDAGEKVVPRQREPGEVPADEKPAPRDQPLPEKVRPADEIAPAVTIRREGDATIEEYRRDGLLYMVVVTPEKGVRYTYLDTDGDGRLEGDPNDGPVQPVYYTLYEWE